MAKKNARRQNIDILKAVCAFFVITIHCPSIFLPRYIEPVTRMAVPVFFMISGYFYTNSRLPHMVRKVKKTLGLLVITEAVYALMYAAGGESYRLGLILQRTPCDILSGNFAIWLPGWYLLVLAYLYVFTGLLDRLKVPDIILGIVIAASIALVITSQVLGDPAGIWQFRTIFKGAPFFLGGRLIRRHEARLKAVPLDIYGFISILSLVAVWVHKFIMLRMGMEGNLYLYAGTPTLVAGLFCFMLFAPPVNAPFLKYVGRNLSMYIYCGHIAIMSVLGRLKLEYESLWLCLISIAVTAIFYVSAVRLRSRLGLAPVKKPENDRETVRADEDYEAVEAVDDFEEDEEDYNEEYNEQRRVG